MLTEALYVISQKLEAPKKNTQMTTNREMDKQTMYLSPYNGILLNDKKEWTTDIYYIMNKSLNTYVEMKKARLKRVHTVYMTPLR